MTAEDLAHDLFHGSPLSEKQIKENTVHIIEMLRILKLGGIWQSRFQVNEPRRSFLKITDTEFTEVEI